MKNSKSIRIITLSGFIILLSGFVCFRAGVFDSPGTVPDALVQAAEMNTIALDTPEVKTEDSVTEMHIMPSSKSGVMFKEPIRITAPDSTKQKPK
jgi:hypothetical protein